MVGAFQVVYSEIVQVIEKLPRRKEQLKINKDIFWLFTSNWWIYDVYHKRVTLQEG